MPLLTFSIREQVPLILSGQKTQTTRLIGERKLRVGDPLYLYFKPRMKRGTCLNCVVMGINQKCRTLVPGPCEQWNNYFGEAKITKIDHLSNEFSDLGMAILNPARMQAWAIADGFKNFEEANKWFASRYGSNWARLPFQVISWKPKWLEEKK